MGKDSPTRALLVVFLTALVCSSLVSAAVVLLRPIQLDNQLLERSRNIMQLTGLLAKGDDPEDVVILELYKNLDNRIVNIDQAAFEAAMDPNTFDMRRAGNDPDLSVEIPADLDEANLGRRSRYAPVYIVWKDAVPDRVILPLNGTGMWSTLYGFIALEGDLNTIAGMTFSSVIVLASSVVTAPGQIMVVRTLPAVSWRRPSEMARTANLVPE